MEYFGVITFLPITDEECAHAAVRLGTGEVLRTADGVRIGLLRPLFGTDASSVPHNGT
jgi:hypothetical protein